MPTVSLRLNFADLPIANAAQPAALSGVATITGEMREGQTPVAAWPTVVNGVPVTSAATYVIRYTTNGGETFTVAKQGSTPQTMDALTAADAGRQYQLLNSELLPALADTVATMARKLNRSLQSAETGATAKRRAQLSEEVAA